MWYLLIISVHYVQINFMHSYHNRLCKISINNEIMKEENITCRIFTVNIEDKKYEQKSKMANVQRNDE